ncbi:MAG: replication protein RepA [Burkholderiales bacterium]
MGEKKSARNSSVEIDYRTKGGVPDWVHEIINTQLAIEEEDARRSGNLGFMSRALVIATMPYKDPKSDVFKRKNGDFSLRIVAGYEGGIPFGIYPRLLMSWLTSEAVIKQSPIIELGDSLGIFLREVLDLKSTSGGTRGSATRVSEQMKRLFGSLITAQYSGTQEKRGFVMKNVLIVDEAQISPEDEKKFNNLGNEKKIAPLEDDTNKFWTPQEKSEAGKWKSKVRLTNNFFEEIITNPVPLDLRAYKTLRISPMAMDLYAWLTYRMSYTQRRSKPIRWESLMTQFGSGYGSGVKTEAGVKQAVFDFKRAFLKALNLVLAVYPQANVEITDHGMVLLPSPPHIAPLPKKSDQGSLF